MKYILVFLIIIGFQIPLIAQIDFVPKDVSYFIGVQTKGILKVDIDNDGDMDILVANGSSFYSIEGNVVLLINNGNQTFSPKVIDESMAEFSTIYFTDMDNDGDIDIIAGSYNYNTNNIKWYENSGNNIFTSHLVTTDVSHIKDLLAKDMDGDGDMDIISGNDGSNAIRWHENEGNSTFTTHYVTPYYHSGNLRVVDYDQDGDIDIISGVTVYSNNGSQIFTSSLIYLNLSYLNAFELFDLDQDGDLDVIFANAGYTHSLVWWENDGSQNYTEDTISLGASAYYIRNIEIGDVDGDGDMDIVTASPIDGTIRWFNNDGTENFSSNLVTDKAKGADHILIFDVDNDTDMDIISSVDFSGEIFWFENDGTENFDVLSVTGACFLINKTYNIDFDLDGDLDIISGGSANAGDVLQFHENIGDYYYKHHIIDYSTYTRSLYAGDLDGDGDMDVLIGGAYILLYENDGNNAFTLDTIAVSSWQSWYTDVIGKDLDQDGDQDILFAQRNGEMGWYENDSLQNFTGHIVEPTNNTLSILNDMDCIDMDDDGDLDLLFASFYEDEVNWYENDGTENFTKHIVTTNVDGVSSIDVVDLDSDGDIDILAGSQTDDKLAWYNNDGSENFSEHIISTTANNIKVVQASDFDLDGDMDISSINSWSTGLAWFENDSSQNFSSNHITNINPNWSSNDDVDNDGDIDIVVANNYQHSIRLYLNDLYGDFLNMDIITYIDSNGNGKMDSTECTIYVGMSDVYPLAFSQVVTDDKIEVYLDEPGTYAINLHVDTTLWSAVDSLNRTIIVADNQFTDTTIFVGVSQKDSIMVDVDITGFWPRCGDTIIHTLSLFTYSSIIDTAYIIYQLDDSAQFISSNPAPDSISDQQYYYGFSNFACGDMKVVEVQVALPLGLDTLYHTMSLFTDTSGFTLLDSVELVEIVRCSYDPNDKQVLPNYGEAGYILNEDVLEYLIRFQNVGNDTAFVVEVLDTLDENLDLSSFHLISSSHPMSFTIDQTSREVSFLFEDINLTDTITNEIESHGFVKYNIRTVDSLLASEGIENTAHIFFDGNTPITTNTTQNTGYDCGTLGSSIFINYNTTDFDVEIDEYYINNAVWTWNGDTIHTDLDGFNFQPVNNGVQELGVHLQNDLCTFDTTFSITVTGIGLGEYDGSSDIVVFPNPTSGRVGIYFGMMKNVQINVTSLTGQLINSYLLENEISFEFYLKGTAGVYLLEIIDKNSHVEYIKIIKD